MQNHYIYFLRQVRSAIFQTTTTRTFYGIIYFLQYFNFLESIAFFW